MHNGTRCRIMHGIWSTETIKTSPRITFDAFKKVISDKTRTAAGESMPGHALFLEDITY